MIQTQTLHQFLDQEIEKINQIKADLIQAELENNELIGNFMQFVLESKGKELRPKLTLLCAKLFGEITPKARLAGILFEILHQATLLHDDVVDEALERRGKPTANITFGNKATVLMGDYLLSKMIEICAKEKEIHLLELLSTTLINLTKGELKQMEAKQPTVGQLIDIAEMKTGSLIMASALAGIPENEINTETGLKIRAFARYFGLAYQIKDDLLDYQPTNKEQYKDLKEQKVNFPLAFALEKSTDKKKNEEILAQLSQDESLEPILDFIEKNEGISQTEALYQEYVWKAKEQLNQIKRPEIDFLLKFFNKFVDRKL